jgi:hypothetical protein
MATITNVNLDHTETTDSDMWALTVYVDWEPSENRWDSRYRLRAKLFEKDLEVDVHRFLRDGEITSFTRGNRDDVGHEVWDQLTVRPSDGTAFDMGEGICNVRQRGDRDDIHAIHETEGEFYAVASIVPIDTPGDLKKSDYLFIEVEKG